MKIRELIQILSAENPYREVVVNVDGKMHQVVDMDLSGGDMAELVTSPCLPVDGPLPALPEKLLPND